jgi:ribosomal protein L11 methyltransferase
MSQWYQVVVARDYPVEKFFDAPGFMGSIEREKAVILYFEKSDEILKELKGYDFSIIQEGDWVEKWREYFVPQKVGDYIVVPPWKQEEGNLTINPSRGFGTGHHETTRLSMILIEESLKNNKNINSMLDVGTGSGILSIAAAKTRSDIKITAIDNDKDALENAFENLMLNDVVEKITISDKPVFMFENQFDLVVANIISSVLFSMSEDLKRLSSKWLILSGILESESDTFLRRMELDEFDVMKKVQNNEWLGYLFRRRQNG